LPYAARCVPRPANSLAEACDLVARRGRSGAASDPRGGTGVVWVRSGRMESAAGLCCIEPDPVILTRDLLVQVVAEGPGRWIGAL
jgi:hypothetical protein